MDLAYHSILRMFDGKAFFAPIENPQRIVDMGTGTGIWVVDVGDRYPSAHGKPPKSGIATRRLDSYP
jgi:hypothetical protein